MNLALDEFKVKAKKLHKALKANPSNEKPIQLKDCLTLLSVNIGFASWQHASDYLRGKAGNVARANHGTLWYEHACCALTNSWFSTYDEALSFKTGYVLPFKTQFVGADNEYLTLLGLDASDIGLVHQLDGDLVQGYATPQWDKLAQRRLRKTLQIDKLCAHYRQNLQRLSRKV